MTKYLFTCLLTCFFFLHASYAQSIIYVHQNAIGTNTGTDWQNAYIDLHTALSAASYGDSIFIASGIYLPSQMNDRDASFILKNGVKTFGGFLGTERYPSERLATNPPTVLSGNIGNPNDSLDNTKTILLLTYPDSTTLIDGMSFENAFARADTTVALSNLETSGGAVYILASGGIAQPYFYNCMFRNNHADTYGGAVYTYAENAAVCSPIFSHCRFINNDAGVSGGAIHTVYKDNTTQSNQIKSCTFNQNYAAKDGGACFFTVRNKLFSITNDTFFNNNALGRGGCFYLDIKNSKFGLALDSSYVYSNTAGVGPIFTAIGDLFNFDDTCNVTIHNSKFINNTITGNSITPLAYIVTGGVLSSFDVQNSIFKDNGKTTLGSFIYLGSIGSAQADTLILKQNIFENTKQIVTGALCLGNKSSETSLNHFIGYSVISLSENSLFCNNIVKNGTEYLNASGSIKGKLLAVYLNPYICNNLFLNNICDYNYLNPEFNQNSNELFSNNIFLNNKNSSDAKVIPVQNYSNISSYFLNNAIDVPCSSLPANLGCQNGNIYVSNGNEMTNLAAGDYTPVQCSKYIHKGLNDPRLPLSDYLGQPRVVDGVVDIGLVEGKSFAIDSMLSTVPTCDSTGAMHMNLPHACSPMIYNWANNQNVLGTGSTNLSPGQYAVTLTDGLGRKINFTSDIEALPKPDISLMVDSVICGGLNGGAIALQAAQGQPPFTYQWLDNPNITDSVRTNLPSGTYTAVISSPNGCSTRVNGMVAPKGNLTLLLDAQEIYCYGDSTGSVSATPLSGLMPFHWVWQSGDTTMEVNNLPQGFYEVTVSDLLNCTATFVFHLNQNDSISLLSDITKASGPTNADGRIGVNFVSGGTPAYHFAWSNGDTTNNLANILPGLYTLTITDANGCSNAFNFEVDFTSSTLEIDILETWTLFPNLASQDDIHIIPSSSKKYYYRIYDSSGRRLLTGMVPLDNRVDISVLHSGLYFVSLFDAQHRPVESTKKLVVAR